MEVYENLGFTAKVTNDKVKIEISISNLREGLKNSPNNWEDENGEICTVKYGEKQEFAKHLAQALIEPTDEGDSLIMQAIESVFEQYFEGGEDFISYPTEGEE